jgi:hypothetical protein
MKTGTEVKTALAGWVQHGSIALKKYNETKNHSFIKSMEFAHITHNPGKLAPVVSPLF